MKFDFDPQSDLEKFGRTVYDLLVENFADTYFVGGLIRDLLLGRNVTDVDIATAARPQEIVSLLQTAGISVDDKYAHFGVTIAKQDSLLVEITTFREETYNGSRYPTVTFINNARHDSDRRDFSVNALYLQAKNAVIEDFHSGLTDLNQKLLRFIGEPSVRIQEDPLRIVRALRFSLTLGFAIEQQAAGAIKNNIKLIKNLSHSRIETELNKIFDEKGVNHQG